MFLGIDIGTSAVKASLADDALQHVDTETVAVTTQHPHPGWSEQDPAAWRLAVIDAVRALVARHDPSRIAALGLSGQMHGAVLLDKNDQVLRPAILWNDGRADAVCRNLDRASSGLAMIAGARPMPGFTAPKILWLSSEEPEIHARIARICLPKDSLGLWLHGNHVTDGCDAAGTWWFDEAARGWSSDLVAATASDPAWLPKAQEGTDLAGTLRAEAAEALGLPAGIPVGTGGGDAAAGAVSIGAVSAGRAFMSLGTSAQMFVVTGSYSAAPAAGLHSFAHCVPDTWFQMAAMLNGARPLSWFSEVTGRPVSALVAEAKAAEGPIPLFLPYLTGERTPHVDAAIRGGFYGIGNAMGAGHLMRAILDAVAYSLCDAADAVRQATAIPERLLAIGGGTRSDLVMQTIADATGLEIHVGDGATAGPSVGAARMAAVAIGAATAEDLAMQPETGRAFAPRASRRAWHDDRLQRYRALYRALKPLSEAPETPLTPA